MERYAVTDGQWERIKHWFPEERPARRGRPWRSHRQIVSAILWVVCSGEKCRVATVLGRRFTIAFGVGISRGCGNMSGNYCWSTWITWEKSTGTCGAWMARWFVLIGVLPVWRRRILKNRQIMLWAVPKGVLAQNCTWLSAATVFP